MGYEVVCDQNLSTGNVRYRVYDEDGDGLGPWWSTQEQAQRIIDVAEEYDSRSAAYSIAYGFCPWCVAPGGGDLDELVSLDLVPAPGPMHPDCARRYVEAGATFPPER